MKISFIYTGTSIARNAPRLAVGLRTHSNPHENA